LKDKKVLFSPDEIANIEALSTDALRDVIWMPDRHLELAA
jgi:hypothetical protein